LTLAFLDKTEHEPTCPVRCGMQPESSSGMGFVGSNWTTRTTALWGPLNHAPRGPHDLTNHWTMRMALLTHLSRRAGRSERADVLPASKNTQPFCNFKPPNSATAWDQNRSWSSRTCCASPHALARRTGTPQYTRALFTVMIHPTDQCADETNHKQSQL